MEWVPIQTNRKGKNKMKVAQLHSSPKLQHIKLGKVTLQSLHHISPSMQVPFLVRVLCGFITYRILHWLGLVTADRRRGLPIYRPGLYYHI
jgi:hypothetical protein